MTTPPVFISYSHDSDEHKGWVPDLARFFLSNGIDVIVDAWNPRRGEDKLQGFGAPSNALSEASGSAWKEAQIRGKLPHAPLISNEQGLHWTDQHNHGSHSLRKFARFVQFDTYRQFALLYASSSISS